jgi:hypothetical protein
MSRGGGEMRFRRRFHGVVGRGFLALAAVWAAGLAMPAPASAQAGAPVRFPGGNAAWTVEVTYREPPTEAAQLRKVEVVRGGRYQRSRYHWSDGNTTETWSLWAAGLHAVEKGSRGTVYVIPAGDWFQTSHMLELFDASSFAWVRRDLFKQEAEYRGRHCLRYEGLVQKGLLPEVTNRTDLPVPEIRCSAWIDQETLRPVALVEPERTALFSFREGPAEEPVPPQRFLDALHRYQAAVDLPRLFKPRSRRN